MACNKILMAEEPEKVTQKVQPKELKRNQYSVAFKKKEKKEREHFKKEDVTGIKCCCKVK